MLLEELAKIQKTKVMPLRRWRKWKWRWRNGILDVCEDSDEDGEVPLETDVEEDQDQEDQVDHVVEEQEAEVSPEKDVLQVY